MMEYGSLIEENIIINEFIESNQQVVNFKVI